MRVPRIHTPQPLHGGTLLRLEAQPSHYLVRVLRLRKAAPLRLFNGEEDQDWHASLVQPDDRAAVVEIGTPVLNRSESPLRLTLAQALCRGEKMDLVLQKAVELGVAAIQPLLTERTEVQLDAERSSKRALHWRGVMIGACEQCGRSRVPELLPLATLPDWLVNQSAATLVALEPSASDGLHSVQPVEQGLTLLVGPEGGLADRELATLAAREVRCVRLGPRILRTESAGLAAIAALQFRWGDLGG